MEITSEHIGKKVFNSVTDENNWILVTAVYPSHFSGKTSMGQLYEDYFLRIIPRADATWLLVSETKKKPSEILQEELLAKCFGFDPLTVGDLRTAIENTLDRLFEGK